MGKTMSLMVKLKDKDPVKMKDRLQSLLQLMGGRRRRLQQQLEEESIKAANLAYKVEQMDNKLSQREEQIVNLGKELEKQRELRLSQMEHSVGYMQRADETNHILKEMEILKEQVVLQQNTSSSKLGELGEEWLVESLQKAFPNNTSICRTTSNHTGDVLFRVESTGKMIMFEVKDVKKGSITGIHQGKDIEKFFKDFDSCGAHGAILISLNGPVDHNVTPLTPQWCQSKPFFYVDCLKTQYPDPVSLLKVSVQMMTFLMEIDDKRGETDNSFHIKIQSYLSTVRLLSGLYQKLYKSNESERKTLEQLKGSLDILNQNMLRDHECSQTSHVTQSLTEIGDVIRSVSNEVKRPRKGKGLSGLERFS